jgi:hypothetical protein
VTKLRVSSLQVEPRYLSSAVPVGTSPLQICTDLGLCGSGCSCGVCTQYTQVSSTQAECPHLELEWLLQVELRVFMFAFRP